MGMTDESVRIMTDQRVQREDAHSKVDQTSRMKIRKGQQQQQPKERVSGVQHSCDLAECGAYFFSA